MSAEPSPATDADANEQPVGSDSASGGGAHSNGPNLVNKQMVLPFIPPKFPSSSSDSNALIKPSEYLRSIHGSAASIVTKQTTVVAEDTLSTCSVQEAAKATSDPSHPGPPPPPLPPQPPCTDTVNGNSSSNGSPPRSQQQPLSTISIHDLNSVQLRRTEKKAVAIKTMSAPPRALTNGKYIFPNNHSINFVFNL